MLALAASFTLVEIGEIVPGALISLGRNSLLIYLISEVLQIGLTLGPAINGKSPYQCLFDIFFQPWLADGWNSVVWTLAWMLLVFIPMAMWFNRQRWYWKL